MDFIFINNGKVVVLKFDKVLVSRVLNFKMGNNIVLVLNKKGNVVYVMFF